MGSNDVFLLILVGYMLFDLWLTSSLQYSTNFFGIIAYVSWLHTKILWIYVKVGLFEIAWRTLAGLYYVCLLLWFLVYAWIGCSALLREKRQKSRAKKLQAISSKNLGKWPWDALPGRPVLGQAFLYIEPWVCLLVWNMLVFFGKPHHQCRESER